MKLSIGAALLLAGLGPPSAAAGGHLISRWKVGSPQHRALEIMGAASRQRALVFGTPNSITKKDIDLLRQTPNYWDVLIVGPTYAPELAQSLARSLPNRKIWLSRYQLELWSARNERSAMDLALITPHHPTTGLLAGREQAFVGTSMSEHQATNGGVAHRWPVDASDLISTLVRVSNCYTTLGGASRRSSAGSYIQGGLFRPEQAEQWPTVIYVPTVGELGNRLPISVSDSLGRARMKMIVEYVARYGYHHGHQFLLPFAIPW